jgi:hypothetical protein
VGFTGTRVADKDDISLLGNKVTGQAIINSSLINRRLKREIKIFNIFVSRQPGLRVSFFIAIRLSVVLFILFRGVLRIHHRIEISL